MRALASCALLSSALLMQGCASVSEHLEGENWKDAFETFTDRPIQWVPVTVTTIATPLLFSSDETNTAESVESQFFGTDTQVGDAFALSLGLAPIVWGSIDALTMDDQRWLEVSSEAMLLTMASTYSLKLIVGRERPDMSGNDSFPSGHSSFAFAGATLLARRWEDTHDGSLWGYFLYLPASYAGISRLEGDRHWLTDIVFGAALGMFTANMVYNAHYGDDDHPGIFGRRVHTSFEPVVEEDRVGLSFSLSF